MSIQYYPRLLTLRDGASVIVRMARPADAPHLLAMHQRLSASTRYLRYLGTFKSIDEQDALEMCSPEDHLQMALVATPEESDEVIIAIAYYVIDNPNELDRAEPSVLVEDEWQGRGLGSLLVKHLAAFASGHGIRCFYVTIHAENQGLLRFIERSGLHYTRTNDHGICELEIDLASPAHIAHLRVGH